MKNTITPTVIGPALLLSVCASSPQLSYEAKKISLSYHYQHSPTNNQVTIYNGETSTITFIDPTIFDETFIRTTLIKPELLDQENIKNLNALDEYHFGPNLELLRKEKLKIQE